MTTTLINAEIELSKQIGDYWSSTTNGAGSTVTIVDSGLMSRANDWITDETYIMLEEEPASTAAIYDERKVSSLDNSGGTLTTLAFSEAPGTGIDYSLHRLFQPSEKRRALVYAARSSFPALFQEVWNEEMVSGNWLRDGSFEKWTTSTDPTIWTDTTVTATQTTGVGYVRHGATSCKLSGATTGTLVQEWKAGTAEFEDLKELRGKAVRFSCQVWCNTASSLRLSINDGATTTHSSYHDGDSAWKDVTDPLEVEADIDEEATRVTFTIHYTTGATAYVDDARVIAGNRSRLYIGHLGLYQNRPHRVEIERGTYSQIEPWRMVRDYITDKDGYLYLPVSCPEDYRLRIRGIGVLDFLASGVSSTAWTATIAVDQPQLDILVAQAAVYLYTWVSMPNYESGTREAYQGALNFWGSELQRRKAQFGMKAPPATISWGFG